MRAPKREYTVKGTCTVYFRDQLYAVFTYKLYSERKNKLDAIIKNVRNLEGTLVIVIAPETK